MRQNRRRKIFVDLEWTPIPWTYTGQRKIAKNEIIEFGAVMLDSQNQEIRTFKRFVKPSYAGRVCEKVRKLTGISTDMLEGAADFATVFEEFLLWCEKGRGNYDIYSWSDSDKIQIREEMLLNGMLVDERTSYMLANWFDLQAEFDQTLGFGRQVSLEKALFTAGIDGTGKAHRALADAENAAALYNFLINPEKQRTTIATIRSVLQPENVSPTLGELFDWSKFMVATR